MTHKHTPAPWKVIFSTEKNLGEFFIVQDVGTFSLNVANTIGGLDDGEEEANAQLIAAAPELLEALEGIVQFADGYPPLEGRLSKHLAVAQAAIKKAKGS